MNANSSEILLYVATGQCTIFSSANYPHVCIRHLISVPFLFQLRRL